MQWTFHNGWMAAAAEAVAVKKQNYEKRKKSFGVVYIYFCQAGGVHTERFYVAIHLIENSRFALQAIALRVHIDDVLSSICYVILRARPRLAK